jgi:hypothetical protein
MTGPSAARGDTPEARPARSPVTREVVRIVWRTAVFFLLLLAVLILWRGSSLFLYEGF